MSEKTNGKFQVIFSAGMTVILTLIMLILNSMDRRLSVLEAMQMRTPQTQSMVTK